MLGTDPLRVYPFGLAPQGVQKPYVTWQTIGGEPENYVSGLPDADNYVVQVDVYSLDAAGPYSVTEVAKALRNAIEPVAYITSWGNTGKEAETGLFRYSFSVDLIEYR